MFVFVHEALLLVELKVELEWRLTDALEIYIIPFLLSFKCLVGVCSMYCRLVYVSHLQGNDTNAVGQRFNRINAGVCGFVRASCLIDTVYSLRTAVGRRVPHASP